MAKIVKRPAAPFPLRVAELVKMRGRGRQLVAPSALTELYHQTPMEIHPPDIDIRRNGGNFPHSGNESPTPTNRVANMRS